ncbi:RelA/SpoT family protein [Patescibacteria group bacterium]|nr:RelA/SpoT family protein [Patescibacteria group bacterium]MBU1703403.1 RelA/SpoT family protein [Patescibacteria group bacterium]MBU1953736.1 RelA/SpoT family protein [Patescibacteria group bacterium]
MAPKNKLNKSLENDLGIIPSDLICDIKRYLPGFHENKFIKAFEFASQAHKGQLRRSGDPYIIHPFETVRILSSLHVDEDTLIAGLLHDVPEDTNRTIAEIEAKFGKRVAFLVEGITKLSKVHYKNDMATRQIESLKNLFIHTAQDPRIILIKLADRLHNMRTLHFIDNEEKRIRISRETLEIFVPIANLLGIEELKSELEDICFRYLFPVDYELLSERMKFNRQNNKEALDKTIKTLEKTFKEHKIDATIYGRLRKLYGIYKRLTGDLSNLQEYDKNIALRIIVGDKEECYRVLGLLHSIFRPRPGKFQDYIAVPKRNGYQSLHTSVFGYNGLCIDFQIRTHQMHLEAEYGIAARYFCTRDNKNPHLEEDRRAEWAAKIMEAHEHLDETSEGSEDKFMEGLRDDILHDRIFVFTPKGDSIDLPQGASCIDFAYFIHSEVGNRALKADVNGVIVPLTTKLNSGDTVHIITSDIPRTPRQAWLDFAKTNAAKTKIQEAFKKVSREDKLQTGSALLQKELDRAGLGLLRDISPRQKKIFVENHKRYGTFKDVLIGIAEGTLRPREFINVLYPEKDAPREQHGFFLRYLFPKMEKRYTPIRLKIVSRDAIGQLNKIFNVLSDLDLSAICSNSYLSLFSRLFICKISVCVHNYSQVSTLCENLEQIDGVKRVERLFRKRQFFFLLACILTFGVWAAHPYILFYIENNWVDVKNSIFSEFLLYTGIFMLFMIVYLLKTATQRSFPDLRETNAFWAVTLLLSGFAILTLLAEVYFFELSFNWGLVTGLIVLFFAYLASEYISYHERS